MSSKKTASFDGFAKSLLVFANSLYKEKLLLTLNISNLWLGFVFICFMLIYWSFYGKNTALVACPILSMNVAITYIYSNTMYISMEFALQNCLVLKYFQSGEPFSCPKNLKTFLSSLSQIVEPKCPRGCSPYILVCFLTRFITVCLYIDTPTCF